MLVLINLDAAVQRRQAMARQLGALGLEFERVGVDLRCVRTGEVDQQLQRRFPGLHFDHNALSNAEIGCWLSHLTAWQRLLDSGLGSCTVIEDDLTLLPDFKEAIAALSQRDSHDIVYLGTSSRNVSQRRHRSIGAFQVHEPVGVIFNTWGYSISRDYAQRLLSSNQRRIALPIDHFLGGRGRRPRPHIGVLQPTVVREDPELGTVSQIGPYTRRIDRSRWVETLRRRVLASPVSEFYYALYRYL